MTLSGSKPMKLNLDPMHFPAQPEWLRLEREAYEKI
jgi:hypothetical protein